MLLLFEMSEMEAQKTKTLIQLRYFGFQLNSSPNFKTKETKKIEKDLLLYTRKEKSS